MFKLFKIVYLILSLTIALFLLFSYIFCYLFGGFNLARYEYRSAFTVLLIIMSILLLGLIIFCIINKTKILHFFIIVFLVLYIFVPSSVMINLREKYSKFEYETWNNKPVVRQEMYQSLETELKIIGMEADKVIELIGEPDYMDKEVLEYKTMPGCICIYLDNNIVTKIEYITPVD